MSLKSRSQSALTSNNCTIHKTQDSYTDTSVWDTLYYLNLKVFTAYLHTIYTCLVTDHSHLLTILNLVFKIYIHVCHNKY